MFRQDNREDPVRAKTRKKSLDDLVKQLSDDPKLFKDLTAKIAAGDPLSMTIQGKAAVELDKEDLRNILNEATKIVAERAKAKK